MRNVRSHVMYKHREQRGVSPSDKGKGREATAVTHTSSSGATNSEGVLIDPNFLAPPTAGHSSNAWGAEFYNYPLESTVEDPIRILAARIISITTSASARSAPPLFEEAFEFPFAGYNAPGYEPLENLKQEYITTTQFFCHGTLLGSFNSWKLMRRQTLHGCITCARTTFPSLVMLALHVYIKTLQRDFCTIVHLQYMQRARF
jgi:hypothetical protein